MLSPFPLGFALMAGAIEPPPSSAASTQVAQPAPAAPAPPVTEPATAEEVAARLRGTAGIRIAHLSDLHFGRGFNRPLWNNLCRIVRQADPQLIIVTGDLVNSPWRWTLRRARNSLESLARGLRPDTGARGAALSNLLVVPGNHDVRVLGIYPIRWIKWLLPVIGLLVYSVLRLATTESYQWMLGVSILAVIALFVARFLCFGDFSKAFRHYLLTRSTHWTDLGLAIYPFDSASRGRKYARGEIGPAEFVKAQEELQTRTLAAAPAPAAGAPPGAPQEPRYRIALLHHHPLPLPYDTGQEPLMIMEDAGAFLSEISNQQIPLVLHGHKHHHHFSRVTINAGASEQFEASVLATGSATAGKRPGRFGFNFNLVSIQADGNARVLPYVATGGTFRPREPFWAQEPEVSARRTFTEAAAQRGFRARTLMSLININSDGDARHVYEIWGFKVGEGAPPLSELPYRVSAGSVVGRVERFDAYPLPPGWTAGLRLRLGGPLTPQSQSGTIEFGRQLTFQDPPLNYAWSYWGINAYAMSREQYYEMYGGKAAPTESAIVTLQHCPYAELVMIVNFPPGFTIEGQPELLITEVPSGHPAPSVTDRLRENLFYSREINVLFLRIPHPPLGLRYEVRWRLAPEPVLGVNAALVGAAHDIAQWLLSLEVPTPLDDPLRKLLVAVEEIARSYFELADRTEDPLDLDVMAYDENSRELQVVAASFPIGEPRWKLRLKHGAGIAGRAFKRRRTRLFVKQRALLEGAPFYFVPLDGGLVSAKGSEIADEVILSVPLSHPEEPDAVYAILSLSSRQRASKLMDLTEEKIAAKFEQFRSAVAEACFDAIGQCMLEARRPLV